jgi:phosphatidate cytidylyltransferase
MTRVLTAAVLIALLAAVLALPWPVFAAAVVLLSVAGWRELEGLARSIGAEIPPETSLISGAATLGVALLPDGERLPFVLATVLVASLWVLMRERHDPARAVRALSATCGGLLWLSLPLGLQIDIRTLPHGVLWLLLLYAAVAVGDSAAYYGGTALGRHRLAPSLSPKKSIEGSVFGLVGAAVGAAVVAHWLPAIGYVEAAMLGVLLGAVGQFGDLLESAIKRAADTKDSSNLLPGHGGILDRIDAHLMAGVALWLVLTLAPPAL